MPHINTSPGLRGQAGAATLVVVLVLSFTLLLAVAFASKSLVFEQRTSSNQYHATQAFEIAEAGADWTLAQLNGGRVDDDCATSTKSTDASLRDRYLSIDAVGVVTPLLGPDQMQLLCVKEDSGWACSCPGKPISPSELPKDLLDRPAFTASFDKQTASGPGVVGLTVVGCTRATTRCLTRGMRDRTSALAMLHLKVALAPAMATLPPATLTVRGAFNAGAASPGVRNADPNGPGLTIDAGGEISAANARIVTTPGTPPVASLLAKDDALTRLTATRLFAAFFGMDKGTFRHLPSARHVACDAGGDCTPALQDAYAGGHRIVWIDGDAMLKGGVIGASDDPLVLIMNGRMRIDGDLKLYGVVHAAALQWDNADAGAAFIRGAVISEGDIGGTGSPDYIYDLDVLTKLRRTRGTFVQVPGSWTDTQP